MSKNAVLYTFSHHQACTRLVPGLYRESTQSLHLNFTRTRTLPGFYQDWSPPGKVAKCKLLQFRAGRMGLRFGLIKDGSAVMFPCMVHDGSTAGLTALRVGWVVCLEAREQHPHKRCWGLEEYFSKVIEPGFDEESVVRRALTTISTFHFYVGLMASRDFSIEIHPGAYIAPVGPAVERAPLSNLSVSTILFRERYGEFITSLNVHEYRKQIALVSQDALE
ncbi:hypothetical protein JOM56_010090 [Amanita muscaria]